VSARDIVSGIISAANRKIQRSSHGGNMASSTGSLPGATIGSGGIVSGGAKSKRDCELGVMPRLDTPTRALADEADGAGSRRNSESVIHSAVAIAAAVPKLLDGSRDSSPRRLFSQQQQQRLQQQQPMSVSAESLNHMLSRDSEEVQQAKPQTKSPFPFDTYQGLQVKSKIEFMNDFFCFFGYFLKNRGFHTKRHKGCYFH